MNLITFPYASPTDGKLVLSEEIVTCSKPVKKAAAIAAAVFYPVTLSLSLLTLSFFSADYCLSKYKALTAERKIRTLQSCTDQQIQDLTKEQVFKLQHQMSALEKDYDKLQGNAEEALPKNYFHKEIDPIVIEQVKEKYCKAESAQERKVLERALLLVRTYERVSEELDLFNGRQKTVDEIRDLFVSKLRFVKISREIKTHIDAYCLYNLCVATLPFVGVYLVFQSNNFLKNSLEKTGLVREYEEEIDQKSWLEPY